MFFGSFPCLARSLPLSGSPYFLLTQSKVLQHPAVKCMTLSLSTCVQKLLIYIQISSQLQSLTTYCRMSHLLLSLSDHKGGAINCLPFKEGAGLVPSRVMALECTTTVIPGSSRNWLLMEIRTDPWSRGAVHLLIHPGGAEPHSPEMATCKTQKLPAKTGLLSQHSH